MIDVTRLTKYFVDSQRGRITAVNDINFNCKVGEIFGLLGPNGAGKTTTLRILATLLNPSMGTAQINGFDILKSPENVRASLGFLSSSTGLYPRLTPREILTYFGRLHNLATDEINFRINKLISDFKIDTYANVRCEKLSSGMKQKVSIARTLINDPPILIFDEPTVGLDVIAAAQTMKTILSYRERGKCILYSTHIMSEAEKLCDRIGIIHQGSLKAIGTLEELRELTGRRYLEDIFLSLIESESGDKTGEISH